MGRYLIQYLPAALVLAVIFWLFMKFWFFKIFPGQIKEAKKMKAAANKYEKDLKKP